MNFHDTKMGHIFFEHQLPQLIRSIQALTAALDKPVQSVALPVEADPDFLSALYYGNYEAATFQPTPESSELTRAINQAHSDLEDAMPDPCCAKLRAYEDARSARDAFEMRRAYEAGFRAAVQMIVAGLSKPVDARPDGAACE